MNEVYEGDYGCQSNDGPEDPCKKIANQCYREPYTPSRTPVIVCDEHGAGLRALGYHFDALATTMLRRDVAREADSPILPVGATPLGELFEHTPDEGEPHPAIQCKSRGCVKAERERPRVPGVADG